MKKISDFLSENLLFLVVKFSIYLNRLVFVMRLSFIKSHRIHRGSYMSGHLI